MQKVCSSMQACRRHASLQEACRRRAGGVQEACRRHAGGVQEACRRRAGGVQEAWRDLRRAAVRVVQQHMRRDAAAPRAADELGHHAAPLARDTQPQLQLRVGGQQRDVGGSAGGQLAGGRADVGALTPGGERELQAVGQRVLEAKRRLQRRHAARRRVPCACHACAMRVPLCMCHAHAEACSVHLQCTCGAHAMHMHMP